MKIYFMSQEYEFAQICSRFIAVYLRLHLKICTLQKMLRTNRFAILRFTFDLKSENLLGHSNRDVKN